MTDRSAQHAVFPIVRAAVTLAATCAIGVGVVSGSLALLGQAAHARLNLIAALLCGGAGLLALLPTWALSRVNPDGAAYGFLLGILFRMALAGGVVLAAQWWWRWPDAAAFSTWVAGWYMLVLIVEVKLIASHVVGRDPLKQVMPEGAHA